jgi:rRNA maturation RNase YbeY
VPEIQVRNAQRKLRIALSPLQEFAGHALRLCLELEEPARSDLRSLDEVLVLLVSDARMSALHKQFLNLAGPTDVITFQHGEIFISVETARANAESFHSSTEDEVRLYLIHGLLHLHGFDDVTSVQARVMKQTQERILRVASRT